MSDQSQEPIFLHAAHRAFLETPSADVLNLEALRLHLYWLMTSVRVRSNDDGCFLILFFGVSGILYIIAAVGLLMTLVVVGVESLLEDGFPHWRVMLKLGAQWGVVISIFLVVLPLFYYALKIAFNTLSWWPYPRIAGLLQKMAQNGTLIQGQLQPIEIEHQLKQTIPYRFTTPSGAELEREFYLDDEYPKVYYPEIRERFSPGRPVWVLYLNDKISVLL